MFSSPIDLFLNIFCKIFSIRQFDLSIGQVTIDCVHISHMRLIGNT